MWVEDLVPAKPHSRGRTWPPTGGSRQHAVSDAGDLHPRAQRGCGWMQLDASADVTDGNFGRTIPVVLRGDRRGFRHPCGQVAA